MQHRFTKQLLHATSFHVQDTRDITKAVGPGKGIWYHAYVIIDIFSRYIVGHTVESAESAPHHKPHSVTTVSLDLKSSGDGPCCAVTQWSTADGFIGAGLRSR